MVPVIDKDLSLNQFFVLNGSLLLLVLGVFSRGSAYLQHCFQYAYSFILVYKYAL